MTHDVTLSSRFRTIAPEQLRAARGLLGWSRNELAQKSNISSETIKNIERGVYWPKKETILTLIETFALNGIKFVHYETLITTPADGALAGHLQVISYAGAVRATASIPEIREDADD